MMHWYNTRIMNRYVVREVEERFEALQKQGEQVKTGRSIVDLALKTYLQNAPNAKVLEPDFKSIIVGQVKLFLFSGHDTTSSSICYIFHCLSQNPSAMARLRAEHDAVLGSNVADAAAIMSRNPHVLNQLPFTTAVIKEALRLFPPVSSTRAGEPGFSVRADDGMSYPTEACLVWSIPEAIQRAPEYWPRPDEFVPERWLASPGDPLHPTKGAWRPFEFGPRNCIGQDLALLDMKITTVMAVREFEISSVYDEWDRLWPRKRPKTVAGERAYQTISGGPSEGLPCRVRNALSA